MGGGKIVNSKIILASALVCCLSFNIPAFSEENYKPVYGEGGNFQYYKFDSGKGFFAPTEESSDANITVKYDEINEQGTNPKSAAGTWINLQNTTDHGGALQFKSDTENKDIKGVFAGNNVSCELSDSKYGGAIAIIDESQINNIEADFIANYVKNTKSDHNMGGAIAILEGSDVNSISGDFVGNYVDAITEKAYGRCSFKNRLQLRI